MSAVNFSLVFTVRKLVFDSVYSRLREEEKAVLDEEISLVHTNDSPTVRTEDELRHVFEMMIKYRNLFGLPRNVLEKVLVNLPYNKIFLVARGMAAMGKKYFDYHMRYYKVLRRAVDEYMKRTAAAQPSAVQTSKEVIGNALNSLIVKTDEVRRMIGPVGTQLDIPNLLMNVFKEKRADMISLATLEHERETRTADESDVFVAVNWEDVIDTLEQVELGKASMRDLKVSLYLALDTAHESTIRYRRKTDFRDPKNGEQNWMDYLSENFPELWRQKLELHDIDDRRKKLLQRYDELMKGVAEVENRIKRGEYRELKKNIEKFRSIGEIIRSCYNTLDEAIKRYQVEEARTNYAKMIESMERAEELYTAIRSYW